VLAALTFVFCIAQLGPALILFAAAGWLYWSGSHMAAVLLALYSVPVIAMDNIVRPILIRKGVDLPLLLITGGVIGGLLAFGLVGIFIGPVVLGVSYTLLVDWAGLESERGESRTAP